MVVIFMRSRYRAIVFPFAVHKKIIIVFRWQMAAASDTHTPAWIVPVLPVSHFAIVEFGPPTEAAVAVAAVAVAFVLLFKIQHVLYMQLM